MTIRRYVEEITIKYQDGDTEIIKADDIVHTATQNYPAGANPKKEDAFQTHVMTWSKPEPLYSNDEGA